MDRDLPRDPVVDLYRFSKAIVIREVRIISYWTTCCLLTSVSDHLVSASINTYTYTLVIYGAGQSLLFWYAVANSQCKRLWCHLLSIIAYFNNTIWGARLHSSHYSRRFVHSSHLSRHLINRTRQVFSYRKNKMCCLTVYLTVESTAFLSSNLRIGHRHSA